MSDAIQNLIDNLQRNKSSGKDQHIIAMVDNFVDALVEIQGMQQSGSTEAVTVAELPKDAKAGDRNFVTDSLKNTFGYIVMGGGEIAVPVYFNGQSWMVG